MNDYDLWFSLINLSHKIKLDLIKKYKETEEIWRYYMDSNINEKSEIIISSALKKAWNKDKIESMKNVLFKENIKLITYNNPKFPSKLKYYDDCPSILFYKGCVEALDENYNIGIVGSRKCTNYGVDVTRIITRELCNNNINIISGLAKGIDTHAHKTCIDNGKYTCAVLGSGIDVVYPRENKQLYNEILINGCIISEYVPGTEPYAYNFPVRNRIISAISDVLIVVEASTKSGSLITAGLAAEQGKDVMVVPGSIFSEQSMGANKLIKDGAYPFTCVDDIFELLGLKYNKAPVNQKNITKLEGAIYHVISDNPIHIDDIVRTSNIDIKQLYEVLFELQLKNEIMCLAGNYYVKINNKI
jgi:DNA processing protein